MFQLVHTAFPLVNIWDIKQFKKMKNLTIRKEIIRNREIYQEAASNIPVQKANARKHYQKLTSALKKRGKTLHTVREIDSQFSENAIRN